METALNGVIVLDFTTAVSGPYCTKILADLGAEMIRIENLAFPRPEIISRYYFEGDNANTMGIFRNKKSINLDIRLPEGKQIFYELVKKSDVVVDNFRLSVPKKLGIDYDVLKKINPKIICCSITGFGPTGPYANRPGFDMSATAIGGLHSCLGTFLEGAPIPRSIQTFEISDTTAGMCAAHGILAALFAREKTGQGQKIDTSLLHATLAILTRHITTYLISGEKPWLIKIPEVGIFKVLDGYVAINATRHFKQLCHALGRDDIPDNPRFSTRNARVENIEELLPIISEYLTPPPPTIDEPLTCSGVPETKRLKGW